MEVSLNQYRITLIFPIIHGKYCNSIYNEDHIHTSSSGDTGSSTICFFYPPSEETVPSPKLLDTDIFQNACKNTCDD